MADHSNLDPNTMEAILQLARQQEYCLGYDVAVMTEQGQKIIRELYGPIPFNPEDIEQTRQFFTWTMTEGNARCEEQAKLIHGANFIEMSPKIFFVTCNNAFDTYQQ